ncbi:hypothetical protein [Alteromonas flava]|uniref:hypothetical protein n=1 Tax=Alteromonas flava TaxID=2048003 RepID=UPI000F5EB337|nr:hypothetical protein [Alteromonas flava]
MTSEPISSNPGIVIQATQSDLTSENWMHMIDDAISRFESTSLKEWAYQVERFENEEGDITHSLEQFEPANGLSNAWSLVRINDQLPSQQQREAFAERKNQSQDAEESANFSISLRELIQVDTLIPINEDRHFIYAQFDVYFSQLGEAESKFLLGTLKYAKHEDYIAQVTIVNTAPLSPMFTAKITELEFSLSFLQIDQAILPEKISLNMLGTFAIFTEIDEVSVDTFSDYEYRGAQLPVN